MKPDLICFITIAFFYRPQSKVIDVKNMEALMSAISRERYAIVQFMGAKTDIEAVRWDSTWQAIYDQTYQMVCCGNFAFIVLLSTFQDK